MNKSPVAKLEAQRNKIKSITTIALHNIIEVYELMLKEEKIEQGGSCHGRLNQLKYKLAMRTKFKKDGLSFNSLSDWIVNKKNEKNS